MGCWLLLHVSLVHDVDEAGWAQVAIRDTEEMARVSSLSCPASFLEYGALPGVHRRK